MSRPETIDEALPPLERDHLMLERHRFALLGAVIMYVVAGVMLVLMAIPAERDLIQRLDTAVFDRIQGRELTGLTAVALTLNLLGSVWVTLPVRLGVGAWLITRRRWEALWAWVGTAVLSELAISILKPLYGRARPPHPDVATTGFSFPSGHAVAGAATAIALVIVLVPAGPKRRYLEVLAGYFALIMGLSRVYLGAHWLSDVVTGVALGAGIAIGVAAGFHELGDRLHYRRIVRATGGPAHPT